MKPHAIFSGIETAKNGETIMGHQKTFETFVQDFGNVVFEQCADGHIVLHTDLRVEIKEPARSEEFALHEYLHYVVILTDRPVEVRALRRAHVVEYGNETEKDALKARFGKAVMNDLPEDHRLMIALTDAEVADLKKSGHVQKVQWHGITCS